MQPVRGIFRVFTVRIANSNQDDLSLMGTRFYDVVERNYFLPSWCFEPGCWKPGTFQLLLDFVCIGVHLLSPAFVVMPLEWSQPVER